MKCFTTLAMLLAVASAPMPAGADDLAESPAAPTVHRAVVLPITFTVYQNTIGAGAEAVPDWTGESRHNLESTLATVLKDQAQLEVTVLPDLSAAEKAAIHDAEGLVGQIVTAGTQLRVGEWKKHRADFDATFGDDLDFLRARTGAEFAIFVDGAQLRQSGGQIFVQIAALAAGVAIIGGAGANLRMAVLDLQNHTVSWFNETASMEAFGITTFDLRSADNAQKMVSRLFSPYPRNPHLTP